VPRRPQLLTTARAAPIPSRYVIASAYFAGGLHPAVPFHQRPAPAFRRAATWGASMRIGIAAPSCGFWSITVFVNPMRCIKTSGRAPSMDEAKRNS
jgi:hypothetical protein